MNPKKNAMFGAPGSFSTPTQPGSSLFLGDPVAISPETAGEMVTASSPAQAAQVAAQAVAQAKGDAAGEAFLQAGPSDRLAAMQFPIISVNNGTLSQTPIDRSLNAGNVNYNVQQLMNEYPIPGMVKSAVAAGGSATITLAAADAVAMGVVAFVVPFLLVVISASTLDASPGAPITIALTGETPLGEAINDQAWTIERSDITKPVTFLFVPFRVIANRPLPALAIVDAVTSLVITVTGLKDGENVSAKVMGYAMNELTEIGRRMGLPAANVR